MTDQIKDEPGLRYDAGKVRFDLVPMDAIHEVARVATYGAAKYEERNWERGMSWSRVVASFWRHFWARARGERIDPESGLTHSGHMAWNIMALCAFDLRGTGTDDLAQIAGSAPSEPERLAIVPRRAADAPEGPTYEAAPE